MLETAGLERPLLIKNRLCEYHLVVYPCPAVSNKINQVINILKPGYKSPPPYIQIAAFMVKEEMEATLSRWIQNICKLQSRFCLAFNNYSGLPPHSIYLRIQDDTPLQKIMNALKILDSFILSNDCPPLHLITKPHLVIASGLSQPDYDQAIKEYTLKSFHEEFTVDKFVLLKNEGQGPGHVIDTFTLHPSG